MSTLKGIKKKREFLFGYSPAHGPSLVSATVFIPKKANAHEVFSFSHRSHLPLV